MISAVSIARGYALLYKASAATSPVVASRSRSARACRRPSGDNPVQLRGPPITRLTVTVDSA